MKEKSMRILYTVSIIVLLANSIMNNILPIFLDFLSFLSLLLFYSDWCYHFDYLPANAWEEGDEVVLITCRLMNPDLDMVNGAVKEKLENFCNELLGDSDNDCLT